jgi:hypothetical protein
MTFERKSQSNKKKYCRYFLNKDLEPFPFQKQVKNRAGSHKEMSSIRAEQ